MRSFFYSLFFLVLPVLCSAQRLGYVSAGVGISTLDDPRQGVCYDVSIGVEVPTYKALHTRLQWAARNRLGYKEGVAVTEAMPVMGLGPSLRLRETEHVGVVATTLAQWWPIAGQWGAHVYVGADLYDRFDIGLFMDADLWRKRDRWTAAGVRAGFRF